MPEMNWVSKRNIRRDSKLGGQRKKERETTAAEAALEAAPAAEAAPMVPPKLQIFDAPREPSLQASVTSKVAPSLKSWYDPSPALPPRPDIVIAESPARRPDIVVVDSPARSRSTPLESTESKPAVEALHPSAHENAAVPVARSNSQGQDPKKRAGTVFGPLSDGKNEGSETSDDVTMRRTSLDRTADRDYNGRSNERLSRENDGEVAREHPATAQRIPKAGNRPSFGLRANIRGPPPTYLNGLSKAEQHDETIKENERIRKENETMKKENEMIKKENARLLDELMERYERKEATMRQSHQQELRRLEGERVSANKQWEDAYNAAMAREEKLKAHRERLAAMEADSKEEMKREREDRDRQIADLKADYEKRTKAFEEKMVAQSKGLEQDMKMLQDHYEYKLQKQALAHEATINEVRKKSEDDVGKMTPEMNKLNEKATGLEKELEKALKHEKQLSNELEKLFKENQQLRNELAASERKGKNLQASHEAQLQRVNDTWSQDMKKVKEQYDTQLSQIRTHYDQQLADKQQETRFIEQNLVTEMESRELRFRGQLERLTSEHKTRLAKDTADLKQRIRSLESDLVDNADDLRPSLGGGALQIRYRELKLKVDTITFNLDIPSYSGSHIDQLDPRGFVQREGKSNFRFLLRSICWTIVMDGLFSSPFGFGAFGREEGKKMLVNLYSTWQRLFDPTFTGYIAAPELQDQEDFEPFYRDKSANWWRSATFQSIQSVVLPGAKTVEGINEASRAGPQSMADIFRDNRDKVKNRILGVISQACNARVSQVIEDEVVGMVECASLLAVEFGAHRAKICFGMPKSGDTVQIGAEFVDCVDGDVNRGNLETVELAVSPSLFMIGDGRKDLTTASCLCPGEIYPQRVSATS